MLTEGLVEAIVTFLNFVDMPKNGSNEHLFIRTIWGFWACGTWDCVLSQLVPGYSREYSFLYYKF